MSIVTIHEEGAVSIIAINRPEKSNAISNQVALELQAAFTAFDRSDQRVAVLTGAGDRAFSAGADLSDIPELWRCVPAVGVTTEKPIIAAIAGWCVGGALVIATMADLAVAADNARFSYPEAKLGFTGGMIAALAARIPHKIAMELILLGQPIDAQRAYEAGLVNKVVPVGEQVKAALTWAQELATYSPLVLRTLKRFVNDGVLPKGPSERMALASRDLAIVRESVDAQEGMRAFKEKRSPVYTGR